MTTPFNETSAGAQTQVEPQPPLRERLAAIEHEQWMEWSQTIARTENISRERLERWAEMWIPYSALDEATKDHDRKWADRVLAAYNADLSSSKTASSAEDDLEGWGLCDVDRPHSHGHPWTRHDGPHPHKLEPLPPGTVERWKSTPSSEKSPIGGAATEDER